MERRREITIPRFGYIFGMERQRFRKANNTITKRGITTLRFDFLEGKTSFLESDTIHVHYISVCRQHYYGLRYEIGNSPKLLFAFTQLLLGSLEVLDVSNSPIPVDDIAGLFSQGFVPK
jgi:hypothetical protein